MNSNAVLNKKGKMVTIGTGALVAVIALSLMLANTVPTMVRADVSSNAANKVATSGTTLQLFAASVKNGVLTSSCGTISGGSTTTTSSAAGTTITTTSTSTSTTTTTSTATSSTIITTITTTSTATNTIISGGIDCGVLLLEGSVKTSNPVDLAITTNQECTILTDITLNSKGGSNNLQTVTDMASETVHVSIDGKAVPVSTDDTGDGKGKVVFCKRVFQVSTNILNQIQLLCSQQATNLCTESTFQVLLDTMDTHGFMWIAPNVSADPYYPGTPAGTNNHDIQVRADLHTSLTLTNCDTCSGTVMIVVGKRTLLVDPGHFAPSINI